MVIFDHSLDALDYCIPYYEYQHILFNRIQLFKFSKIISFSEMELPIPSTSTAIKRVDRFGFFEADLVRSICCLFDIRVGPQYDVKLENQRLKKWLEMLKNWKKLFLEIRSDK